MKDTARAAAQLGVTQVNGFTGSSVWHLLYSFPPNDYGEVDRGYQEFAERWGAIMDVFDAEGVRFGLEVHPTEIAYDFVTTRRTLDAIGNREAFGINLDPSHFAHQFLDTAQFALDFADRIYHVHVKDSRKRLDGRRSILASHLNFGEEARGWDFVSRVTATSTSRTCSEPSIASATRGRSRSSGRTAAWIATGALRTRSRSCAAPTSPRRRSRSTQRCRRRATGEHRRRRVRDGSP